MKARNRMPQDVAALLAWCEEWCWGDAAVRSTAMLNKYGIARQRGKLIETVVEFVPAESAAGAKPAPVLVDDGAAGDAAGCPANSGPGGAA